MANYKYTAYSKSGEKVNGVIEALSRTEAASKIKEVCPIVEDITEVRDTTVKQTRKKVPIKELCLMCERFAIVLNVGLPILQSVEMMASQTEDKNLKLILEEIAADVAMGRSLSASFEERSECFPSTFVETIRSGEEMGNLSSAFSRLKVYYESSSKTKQKVKSAMTYPILVISVGIVVLGIIIAVAVPTFTKAFADMGTELPGITKFVIWLSDTVKAYGLFAVALVAAIVLGCKLYARTDKGAEFFGTLILKMPLVGDVVTLSSASQFAQTLSMMVMAGMPIIRSLEISGKAIGNYIIRRDILETANGVTAGRTLGGCLSKSEFLPKMLVEMTTIGEQTGTLEQTLKVVGDYYDNEVQISTAKLLSFLEPASIAILAVLVVIILLAVYMPMFSMYSGM